MVIDDAIAIRSQCYLALTFDHRLIDGALADQFTGKVKSVLENWSEEVLYWRPVRLELRRAWSRARRFSTFRRSGSAAR